MFTNFSNFPVPEGAGEYDNDYGPNQTGGPVRSNHAWRQMPLRTPGMTGPTPYERHRQAPYHHGNMGPSYGYHQGRWDRGPLDPFGHYPPLPLNPDFTPNAGNAGPSLLDRERDLREFKERTLPLFTDFNSPRPARVIKMTFDVSARKIDINWTPPDVSTNLRYAYHLEVIDGNETYSFDMPWHRTMHSIRTAPGNEYEVTLQCRDSSEDRILASASEKVKAVFSMEEMRTLYTRAIENIGSNMQGFYYLYRCKPQPYWDDIYHNCQGIMEKYLKDNNGQPANSINGVISGLFFSARTAQDGSLPYSSPFGNRRLVMEAPILLNPLRHSMYFADYYCNYITHYVTVVICRKNSDTDNYCASRLIRLNPEKNPFLRVEYRPPQRNMPEGHHFFVNKGVWVEIYYTESINANHLFSGAGTSRIGGLPNNKQCELCNLYPVKTATYTDEAENKENEITYLDLNCSTFNLLTSMDEERELLGENWEDVVETLCHLVNGACEMAESLDDVKDPIQQSMDKISDAMVTMDDQISQCQDIEVLAIADDIRSLVSSLKEKRLQISQMLSECASMIRIQKSTPPDLLCRPKPMTQVTLTNVSNPVSMPS